MRQAQAHTLLKQLAPPDAARPGVLVTGTDTHVGKTVVACALAHRLRTLDGLTVGVMKPAASGCRRDREGLVSEDAEALAHFSNCLAPLKVIHPVRFRAPLAPAVAAEQENVPFDWQAIGRSWREIDAMSDVMVIEGVGGAMVPLDGEWLLVDLAVAMGYPVVVVARADLGTLNHTAMTVDLLRRHGLRIAGVVINGYDPESPDPSVQSNPRWIRRMTGCEILATVPRVRADAGGASPVAPHRGRLPEAILDAMRQAYWPDVLASPRPGKLIGRK